MKHLGVKIILILVLTVPLTGRRLLMPAAKAIDPVTIAILAPIALKGARMASPYVIAGLHRGGRQLLTIGGDIADILRLPLGVIQATAGAPFGFLGDGLSNMGSGLLAPVNLVLDVIMLPFAAFGVGV